MTAAFLNRDELGKLIDRWHAPRIREQVIEARASEYLRMVEARELVGCSFVEFLIVKGVARGD